MKPLYIASHITEGSEAVVILVSAGVCCFSCFRSKNRIVVNVVPSASIFSWIHVNRTTHKNGKFQLLKTSLMRVTSVYLPLSQTFFFSVLF